MAAPVEATRIEVGTLVIGDLHLDPSGGPDVDAFVGWLDGLRCPRLIILGDLFDRWIGHKQLADPGSAAVTSALRRFVERAQSVDLIPGNRDFLLCRRFEERSGGRLHRTGLVGTLGAERLLVVHGDSLCTRDRGFQLYRMLLMSRLPRLVLPRLPRRLLLRIAGRLRDESQRRTPMKPVAKLEMQADAAASAAAESGADLIVCGHAHRFRDVRIEGGPRWMVIDGWGGERDTLRFEPAPLALAHGEVLA